MGGGGFGGGGGGGDGVWGGGVIMASAYKGTVGLRGPSQSIMIMRRCFREAVELSYFIYEQCLHG